MSLLNLAEIPGYAEAQKQEREARDLAFCDWPVPLCGLSVRQFTLTHLLILGNCDNAFSIPTNAKLSIQCDEAALLSANTCGTDAGTAIAWAAATLFPTSTGGAVRCALPDAGFVSAGVFSIAPAVGAG